MLILNKDNFKTEVLENKNPVLVDFYSIGCGPCRTMDKVLQNVDGKIPTKLTKIEASTAIDIFNNYNVSHVPTFILFKDGKEVERKSGIINEKEFTEWLSKYTVQNTEDIIKELQAKNSQLVNELNEIKNLRDERGWERDTRSNM